MGQVPQVKKQGDFPHFLLIGRGRVARHFSFYFQNLSLHFETWHREQLTDVLVEKATRASHILLLISDDAIEPFIQEHHFLAGKTLIHFSGQLQTELAQGVHPLMTFAETLYTAEFYQCIPFITVSGEPSFAQVFPQLPNPSHAITAEQKPLYHALCVLAGNFTTILWQKLMEDFREKLNLEPKIALPYLGKIVENLMLAPDSLTGPIARGDRSTVSKNLQALKGDPFQQVYTSFIQTVSPDLLDQGENTPREVRA